MISICRTHADMTHGVHLRFYSNDSVLYKYSLNDNNDDDD